MMDYKTMIEIQKQKTRVKLAINEAIPVGVDIAVIIIALAELQAEMGRLLYKDEDEDDE